MSQEREQLQESQIGSLSLRRVRFLPEVKSVLALLLVGWARMPTGCADSEEISLETLDLGGFTLFILCSMEIIVKSGRVITGELTLD